MDKNKYTIIELRLNGKLINLYFDGPKVEIENSILEYINSGATEISVVENPKRFVFSFLT